MVMATKVRGTFAENKILPGHMCEHIAKTLLCRPEYWTKFGENTHYHSAYFGPIYGRSTTDSGRNHPLFSKRGHRYDYIMSWPEFLWPLRDAAMHLMQDEHADTRETDKELLQCNVNTYYSNTSMKKNGSDNHHSNGCVSWHTDEPFGVFEPKYFGRKTITICVLGDGTFLVRKCLETDLSAGRSLPQVYKAFESVYESFDVNESAPIEHVKLSKGDAVILVGAALHGCKHAAVMEGNLRMTANFRIVSRQHFNLTTAKRLDEQPIGTRVPLP